MAEIINLAEYRKKKEREKYITNCQTRIAVSDISFSSLNEIEQRLIDHFIKEGESKMLILDDPISCGYVPDENFLKEYSKNFKYRIDFGNESS